jgi:prepilin-type N-terminal cleavage/methylation domain-containing protein
MTRRPNRKSRGVTIIELLTVVSMIGILVSLAYWGFAGVMPRFRLQGAAADAANLLVLTRARAIAQNRYYLVHFQASSYRTVWDKNGSGTVDAGDEVTSTGVYGTEISYLRPAVNPLPVGDLVGFDPKGNAFNITAQGQVARLRNQLGVTRDIRVQFSGLVKKL